MIDDTLPGINGDLARLEQELDEIPERIRDCHNELLEAQRVLDQAKARAYLSSPGSIPERNANVVIETVAEVERVDVARAAYDYVRERSRSVRDSIGALQTRSANLRKEIDLATRG